MRPFIDGTRRLATSSHTWIEYSAYQSARPRCLGRTVARVVAPRVVGRAGRERHERHTLTVVGDERP